LCFDPLMAGLRDEVDTQSFLKPLSILRGFSALYCSLRGDRDRLRADTDDGERRLFPRFDLLLWRSSRLPVDGEREGDLRRFRRSLSLRRSSSSEFCSFLRCPYFEDLRLCPSPSLFNTSLDTLLLRCRRCFVDLPRRDDLL
jgi:hypothetical protein